MSWHNGYYIFDRLGLCLTFPFANTSQINNISGTVNIGGDIYTIGALATGLGRDNLLTDGFFTGLSLD